jgi:hypothetical protein
MVDLLGRFIILKVFSHQLNEDFSIKITGKQPNPNLSVILANQIVDNATKQAAQILSPHEKNMNKSITLLFHLVGALLLKDASLIKVQPRYYIRK